LNLKLSLNLDLKTLEKKIEKELENPEKKKKRKQPSRPTKPSFARAPSVSDRWAPPVGGDPHPSSLSPSRCLVVSPCRRFGPLCTHASVPCPVGPARQSLPLLLQPLACADRAHARRDCLPAPNRHPDPLYKSPHTPLPHCLAHFTSAHSPELRAPVLQARRSFPITRPPAPEFVAGRARPPSAIMLRHRYTQPCPHPCSTRGEFPHRTFSSLSPISSVPSTSHW
jgi:hypothetical protein